MDFSWLIKYGRDEVRKGKHTDSRLTMNTLDTFLNACSLPLFVVVVLFAFLFTR